MRALFEVTSGGALWIVALAPARWAMRILPVTGVSFAMLNFLGYCRASENPRSSADRREGALIGAYH
jgi:hypothetical protein